MKVQEVITKMKSEKLLDDREIYAYASRKGIVGGAVGAVARAVILSVYETTLYIHRAAVDNSYKECLGTYDISNIKLKKVKSGLFGGKFVFEYEGKKYSYELPSGTKAFAKFFAGV